MSDTEILLEERTWLPATATIHERMVVILAELPAIGKGQKNEQQGFMYRGHDDVLNALNPLLAQHGVFAVPQVLERLDGQRTTRSGSVMYEVNLHVSYRFYGLAGDWIEASAWGEGTDSGDKSTNKAMTMAFKNVLAQTFAVSTEEGAALDADRGSPEETVAPSPLGKPPVVRRPDAPGSTKVILERLTDADPSVVWPKTIGEIVAAWYGNGFVSVKSLPKDEQPFFLARLANFAADFAEEAGKDGDFPPPTPDDFKEAVARNFDGLVVEATYTPVTASAEPEQDSAPVAAATADEAEVTAQALLDGLPPVPTQTPATYENGEQS